MTHFNSFALGLIVLALTLGLTIYVFRHRLFEYGSRTYKKGVAANPPEVRRQNPPDGR
jgi:hypothetical protein